MKNATHLFLISLGEHLGLIGSKHVNLCIIEVGPPLTRLFLADTVIIITKTSHFNLHVFLYVSLLHLFSMISFSDDNSTTTQASNAHLSYNSPDLQFRPNVELELLIDALVGCQDAVYPNIARQFEKSKILQAQRQIFVSGCLLVFKIILYYYLSSCMYQNDYRR
jgi:hypothetical protein